VSTFLWGCLGAIAPEIVRWYRISRHAAPDEWKRASYWVATLGYVALGGLFATLIAQPNGYAAFVAGLSTEYAVLGVVKSAASPADADTAPSATHEELSTRPIGPFGLAALRIIEHASYLGRRT
jgi:hypothetical protein